RRVGVERGALEQLDRGGLVGHAHDEDAHRTTSSCSCWTLLRRCSWYARICSSIDRSTFRTATPSGTVTMAGAKLRMLVTPAATSASATPCAASPGVAM